MFGPLQIVFGVLALLIMAGLSLLIMVRFDRAVSRMDRRIRELTVRIEQPLERRREHRRAVRALKHLQGPPIERLGYDLRRLRHMVQHSEHGSATQQQALRQAYDEVLIESCRMFDLRHDLDRPTVGLERDIERVRVEALLESRGMVLSYRRPRGLNAEH